jgi:hypothetical protein
MHRFLFASGQTEALGDLGNLRRIISFSLEHDDQESTAQVGTVSMTSFFNLKRTAHIGPLRGTIGIDKSRRGMSSHKFGTNFVSQPSVQVANPARLVGIRKDLESFSVICDDTQSSVNHDQTRSGRSSLHLVPLFWAVPPTSGNRLSQKLPWPWACALWGGPFRSKQRTVGACYAALFFSPLSKT